MPFCSKCGAEVSEGVKFCPKCGNTLQVVSAQTGQAEKLSLWDYYLNAESGISLDNLENLGISKSYNKEIYKEHLAVFAGEQPKYSWSLFWKFHNSENSGSNNERKG